MPTVLVVEDEDDIRDMLLEVLDDAGFTSMGVATADSATGLLEGARLRLIITDIDLPGRLDGIDLARWARQKRPEIPILFISGRPPKLQEARGVPNPVAFLAKPFGFKIFVTEVQALAANAHW